MIFAAMLLLTGSAVSHSIPIMNDLPENPAILLKKILLETRELGMRPGENFIKQEFFIGGPDDDDTNKDTSVVILIQPIDGTERMTIQVTRMERDRSDPRIKTARETKSIVGAPDGKGFRITRSDFSADELESVCAQVLRAVQDKKRLLRLGLISKP